MSMKIYNEVVSKFNEKTQKWETIYEDSYQYNGQVHLAQGPMDDPKEVYRDMLDISAIINKQAQEHTGHLKKQQENLSKLVQDSVELAKNEKMTLDHLQSRVSLINQIANNELDLNTIAIQKKAIDDEITKISRRYFGKNKAIGQEKIKQLQLDKEMLESQENILRAEEESAKVWGELDGLTGGMAGQVKSMVEGFKEAGPALKGLLVAGAIVGLMKMIAQTTDQIGDNFGAIGVTEFEHELRAVNREALALGYSSEEASQTVKDLSQNFGIAFDQATKMAGASMETARALGIGTDQSAALIGQLITIGGHTAESAKDSLRFTAALAHSAGVAPGVVMNDMAEASEHIAGFTKGTGENMQRAAVQARRMGLSLSDTAGIAEGLLDFQTSIQKEMEASILIGKNINLQRARELALMGELEGSMDEVLAQIGDEDDFLAMNIIQRKAIADLLGVSVEKMANMYKFAGKTTEELKSMRDLSIDEIVSDESMSRIQRLENQFRTWGAGILDNMAKLNDWGGLWGLLLPLLGIVVIYMGLVAVKGWAMGAGLAAAGKGAAAAAPGFAAFTAAASGATGPLLSIAVIIAVVALGVMAIGYALEKLGVLVDFLAKGFETIAVAITNSLVRLADPSIVVGMLGLAGAFWLLGKGLALVATSGVAAIPAMAAVIGFTWAMDKIIGGGDEGGTTEDDKLNQINLKLETLVNGFESGRYQTGIGKAVDGIKVKAQTTPQGAISR